MTPHAARMALLSKERTASAPREHVAAALEGTGLTLRPQTDSRHEFQGSFLIEGAFAPLNMAEGSTFEVTDKPGWVYGSNTQYLVLVVARQGGKLTAGLALKNYTPGKGWEFTLADESHPDIRRPFHSVEIVGRVVAIRHKTRYMIDTEGLRFNPETRAVEFSTHPELKAQLEQWAKEDEASQEAGSVSK